ncbi:MAG: hypothetical protein AAF705_12665 [Bacteroidota bacterium]
MNKFLKQMALAEGQAIAPELGLGIDKVHPLELLLFAELNANENIYEISLSDDDAVDVLNIAMGIKKNDAYVAVAAAIGVAKVPIIADVEYPGALDIAYHPDANLFAGPASASTPLTEVQAIKSIWTAGTNSLRTNQTIRTNPSPNLEYMKAFTTQHSATTVNETYDVFNPLGAAIRLAGGETNIFTISHKCKDKSDIAGTAAGKNYLVVRFAGAVLKGGNSAILLN